MRTILLLAANPRGTERLRLDEEVKRIEQGLERSRQRDRFRLVVKWAVTDDDLRRALLDNEPEIVHFSGHGTGSGGNGRGRHLVCDQDREPGGLAFEDERGEVQPASGAALGRLFELFADQVKCVVLNACYSEVQATAIVRHIDYVIGMSQAIGDAAAIKFAVGFYDAIGAGKPYDFAFRSGCCAIDLRGIPERLTPVLKVRPRAESTPGPTAVGPPQPAAGAERRPERAGAAPRPALDAGLVERAAECLAEYIGPVAFVLVPQVAAETPSVRRLYERLAAEIGSREARTKFLASRPR